MLPLTKVELAIRFLVALANEGGEVRDVPEALQPVLEWCVKHGLVSWDWVVELSGGDPSIYRITEDGTELADLFVRVMELPETEVEPEGEIPPPPPKPKPKQVDW